jgi:hypothetical protein
VALALGWIRGVQIPTGFRVDVVDLGERCDVTIRAEGTMVVALGAATSGACVLAPSSALDSDTARLAVSILRQWREARPARDASVGTVDGLRLLADIADDAIWVAADGDGALRRIDD